MLKSLMLLAGFYSVVGLADNSHDACLGIQKLTHNKITFFYNQQDKADKPYFYVKVMSGNETPEKSLTAILGMNGNLLSVPNTTPHLYQVPEYAKKLYIVKAQNKLAKFDVLAEVLPALQDVEAQAKAKGIRRNVNIYPQRLPPETKLLAGGEGGVNICELAL
ncbi:MAG: hypothetical protein HOP02_07580 [Methylococcaceae bacterium]|nr:hypothetical protein [Methylococcaceae bacterium]